MFNRKAKEYRWDASGLALFISNVSIHATCHLWTLEHLRDLFLLDF
jgi:hypothetical protein